MFSAYEPHMGGCHGYSRGGPHCSNTRTRFLPVKYVSTGGLQYLYRMQHSPFCWNRTVCKMADLHVSSFDQTVTILSSFGAWHSRAIKDAHPDVNDPIRHKLPFSRLDGDVWRPQKSRATEELDMTHTNKQTNSMGF